MKTSKPLPTWNGTRWRLRKNIDGKQIDFYSSTPGDKGVKECIRKYNERLAGASLTRAAKVSRVWSDYLESIRAELGPESDEPNQAMKYGKNYILPVVGHMRPDTITDQRWQDLINHAKSVSPHLTRTSDGRLSKKTLMNLRGHITGFCRFCMRSGLIDHVPELKVPRNRETVQKRIMQLDDLARFLTDRSPDWHYLRAWQIAVLYGLRPGEALGIQIKDVQGSTLTIRRSVNSHGAITSGKNQNAQRSEHIFAFAAELIQAQIKSRKYLSTWLFPSKSGGQPSQQQSRREFRAYLAFNGFPDLTPYELRHTFVSVMRSRVSEDFVKMIVGHSPSMDTFGTYGHEMDDDKVKIGDVIGDVWNAIAKR